MRLINVASMEMEEFFDDARPPFAILSHTWGTEEVTYQDFQHLPSAMRKTGWPKIENAIRLTEAEGLAYLWCDTCCIDKTSSAELQEAINSMYRWYEDSTVCFAFLNDVRCPRMTDTWFCSEAEVATETLKANSALSVRSQRFANSRWFTRGWTLQELIAPNAIRFFNQAYNFVGFKYELAQTIMLRTGIDSAILQKRASISGISIAQRMSWAAGTKTSRVEDRAYSLLGIFDVNMPMIYGEGDKAFIRLQEEIIKASDDDSIFAWETLPRDAPHSGALLAGSPDAFSHAGDIVVGGCAQPFEMTNGGLRIELPLRKAFTFDGVGETEFAMLLNCHHKEDITGTLALRLTKPEASEQFHPIVGHQCTPLAFDQSPRMRKKSRLAFISSSNIAMCTRQPLQIMRTIRPFNGVIFKVDFAHGTELPCEALVIKAYPGTGWDADHRIFRTTAWDRIRAGLVYQCRSGCRIAVVFGYDNVAINWREESKAKRPSVWAHHYHSDLELFPQFCDSHVSFTDYNTGAGIDPQTGLYFKESDVALARAVMEEETIASRVWASGDNVFTVCVEISRFCELEADSSNDLPRDQRRRALTETLGLADAGRGCLDIRLAPWQSHLVSG